MEKTERRPSSAVIVKYYRDVLFEFCFGPLYSILRGLLKEFVNSTIAI